MKNFILISCFLLSSSSAVNAQYYTKGERYKMDISARGGYAFTFFDESTQFNYFGNIEMDFLLFDRLYLMGGAGTQNFYKSRSKESNIMTFYTNLMGCDLGFLYEFPIVQNHSLFLGASENVNLFSAHGIQSDGTYITSNGYLSRPVYNSRIILRYRGPISEAVDFELGASYNILQSHFADLYTTANETLDTYILVTGGVVYYIGSSTLIKFVKRSSRLFCPGGFRKRF